LTGTKTIFEWRDSIEGKSFHLLKQAVAMAIHRYGFDPSLKTILESDASDYGGGCVIKQVTADNKERVLLYDSFVLSRPKKNMSPSKKNFAQ
jgi:hypothetical protein